MNFKGLKENNMNGLITVVLGLLLFILKGEVISLILTVVGVLVLVSAFFDWRTKQTNSAIVKAVIGICILAFGWLFVNLALYIVAAIIIIAGLKKIVAIKDSSPINLTLQEKCFLYAKPVLTVLAGVILFFNQGGVINWVFIVVGILLIVEGLLEIFDMKK